MPPIPITARLIQGKQASGYYEWSIELPASLHGCMDSHAFSLSMKYFNESQRVRDKVIVLLTTIVLALILCGIGATFQALDLDFTGGYFAVTLDVCGMIMTFLGLAWQWSMPRRLRTRLRLAVETENAYYPYWCRQRLGPVVSVVWSITSRTVWINLSGEGRQPVEEPVILCTIITDENEPQPIAAITVVAVEGVDPSSSSTADTTTATATATAANSTPDISSVEGTHGRGREGNVVIEVHAEAMPMQSTPSILTSADVAPVAAVAAVAASGSELQPINNSGAARSSSSSSSVARFIRTTVSALTFAPASQDELDHPTSYTQL